jgi:hypothetical protein
MSANAGKRFVTRFKVRPTTEHPSYWNFQWAMLGIVLTAQHDFEAEEKATAIIAQLPFEVVGSSSGAVPWSKPSNEHTAFSEEIFAAVGFAFWIIRVPLEEFGSTPPEDILFVVKDDPGTCLPGEKLSLRFDCRGAG